MALDALPADGTGPGQDPTELLLAAQAGDRTAAEAFVRATRQDVWTLCRHLSDPGAADDLAQETYARAFAGAHHFAARASARTWLLAISRRVCADAVGVAVRGRARPVPVAEAVAGPAGAVELDRLLAALPRERREAFVLTQLMGWSYVETAAVCRCPVGTVRSRVARAREDLQRAWLA